MRASHALLIALVVVPAILPLVAPAAERAVRLPPRDPFGAALWAAEAQAGLSGPAVPVRADAPPSALAVAVAQATGDVPGDAATRLAALDALAPAPRAALADALASFLAFHAAAQRAAATHDAHEVLAARVGLLASAAALAHAFRGVPLPAGPALHVGGFAIDLQGDDSVYAGDLALLIDVGGDDTYLNNAGGAGSFPALSGSACAVDPGQVAAALFDLAGSDTYGDGRWCGANGGGWGGHGLLVDSGGTADVYLGGVGGVNGGADGGNGRPASGLLLDTGGHDLYVSGSTATNGGGWASGRGLLVDGAGDDRYIAGGPTNPYCSPDPGDCGTNGGARAGQGMLLDLGGDDAYVAGGLGANGGTALGPACLLACVNQVSDGAGALIDVGGTDTYSDRQGGSGTDRTVLPKGATGAQLDLP